MAPAELGLAPTWQGPSCQSRLPCALTAPGTLAWVAAAWLASALPGPLPRLCRLPRCGAGPGSPAAASKHLRALASWFPDGGRMLRVDARPPPLACAWAEAGCSHRRGPRHMPDSLTLLSVGTGPGLSGGARSTGPWGGAGSGAGSAPVLLFLCCFHAGKRRVPGAGFRPVWVFQFLSSRCVVSWEDVSRWSHRIATQPCRPTAPPLPPGPALRGSAGARLQAPSQFSTLQAPSPG